MVDSVSEENKRIQSKHKFLLMLLLQFYATGLCKLHLYLFSLPSDFLLQSEFKLMRLY